MTGFTAPSGGADAKYISATSVQNTITVEVGKKYLISVAISCGFDVTNMFLSNCTTISETNPVQSNRETGNRYAWLKTFYIKATGTTLTLTWTLSSGGANSTLQAITCYEI